MGKILVSFREDMLPPELKHRVKLGVISEEEVPSHHKRYIANEGKAYADVLKHTLSFNNPATSLHMCNVLAVPVRKTTSFVHSLDDMIITKDDTAIALRKAQSAVWAYKSVKEGIAYFKAGNNTEAFQCLNKALQIDPENVEALVARGALFANNNNLRRALEDFEEALSLNPNHSNGRKYTSETLVALGKYYEEKLDLAMAKKTYKKALQVNSQNATARDSLLAIEEQERKKMQEQRTLDYAAVGTIPLNTNIAIGQIEKPPPTKEADTREKLKLLLKEEKKEKYKRERYSSLSSPSHTPPPSYPTKVAVKEEVKKEEQKWIATEVPIENKPDLLSTEVFDVEEVPLPEPRPIKKKPSESKYDDPVKRSYAVDKAFREMLFKEAEKKLKATQEVQMVSEAENVEPKTEPSLEDRLAMYYKKHGYGKDSSESEKSHVSEDYRSIVKATKFSRKSKKQKSKKRKHAKDSSSDDMPDESSKKRKSKDKGSGRAPSPKVVFVMRKDDDLHYSKLYTHSAFRDDDEDDDDEQMKGKGGQKENDGKKKKKKDKTEQESGSSSRSSSQSSSGSGSRSQSHSRSRSKSSEEKKVKKKKRKRNYDSEDDEHKYDENNQREKQFRMDRHKKSNFNMYGEDKYYKYGGQKYDRYYEKYNQYDNYNRGYKYYDDYSYKYPKYEKYSKYERGGKYEKGDGYSSRYIANDDKENPKEKKDIKDVSKRYSYSSTSTRSKSRSKSRSKTPSKSRSKSRSKSHSKSRSKSHSKSRSKSRSKSISKSQSNSRSRSRSKSPTHHHRHRDERYHRDYHYQQHHHQQQRYFRGRRFFRQPYRYHNRGRFYQNRVGFRPRFNWKTGSGPAVGHLISRAPSPETLKKVQQAAKQQKALKAEVEREQEALTIQKITKAVVMQNWVDEENKSLEAARAAAKKITESLSKNSGDEKGGKHSLREMESFLEQLKAQKRDKGDVKND